MLSTLIWEAYIVHVLKYFCVSLKHVQLLHLNHSLDLRTFWLSHGVMMESLRMDVGTKASFSHLL
jgi:hypothetical protein